MAAQHQFKFFAACISAAFICSVTHAQISSNHITGLRDNTPRWHAITGARVVTAPGRVIERGTIVMRDGRITAVGTESTIAVPQGARVWKLEGRTVYAGFIDMASNIGVYIFVMANDVEYRAKHN